MRLVVNRALPLVAVALLAGCSLGGLSGKSTRTPQPLATSGPAADYPVITGAPFTIDGKTWTPSDTMNYDEVGYALASGEGTGVTAAHKTLPLPSYVEITSLETGATVLVRLERRGPMRNDRLVELSADAATQLGIGGDRLPVRVRRVNPPEPERALLRTGQPAPARMETPRPLLAVLMRKLTGEAAPAPVASPEPTATPRPVAAPSPAPARPARAKPAPRPTPSATPSPRPSASPSPAPRTAATGSLVVQAAAFSTQERANAAAAKLGGTVSAAGRLWRVRLGPYANQSQAAAALARAKAAGYPDARIQRAD